MIEVLRDLQDAGGISEERFSSVRHATPQKLHT